MRSKFRFVPVIFAASALLLTLAESAFAQPRGRGRGPVPAIGPRGGVAVNIGGIRVGVSPRGGMAVGIGRPGWGYGNPWVRSAWAAPPARAIYPSYYTPLVVPSTTVIPVTSSVPAAGTAGVDQVGQPEQHHSTIVFPTHVTKSLFTTTFPDSNTAYVHNVFRALLNRDPAAEEVREHVDALNNGYSRIDYAKLIYDSDESLHFQINEVFQRLFGRQPQPADRTYWAGELRRGIQPEWMVVTLMDGQEYQGVHQSNEGFITGAYYDILGRVPTSEDIAYWNNFLYGGQSRSALAAQFAYSEEIYRRTVEDVFTQVLHRAPTEPDYANWVTLLKDRTIPVSRMVVLLLASDEFNRKAVNARD